MAAGWNVSTIVITQSGMPFVISGDSTGAMVAPPNRIQGVSVAGTGGACYGSFSSQALSA